MLLLLLLLLFLLLPFCRSLLSLPVSLLPLLLLFLLFIFLCYTGPVMLPGQQAGPEFLDSVRPASLGDMPPHLAFRTLKTTNQ